MFINILLNFRLFSKQSISAHKFFILFQFIFYAANFFSTEFYFSQSISAHKFFNGILFYTSCCHARFARPAIQSAPVMLTNNSTELFFTTHGHKLASLATGLRPYYKCFDQILRNQNVQRFIFTLNLVLKIRRKRLLCNRATHLLFKIINLNTHQN